MTDTPTQPKKVVTSPTHPVTHDHEFSTAVSAPIARLVEALHLRLVNLEIELGFRDKPVAPAAPTPPVAAPTTVVTPVTPPPVTFTPTVFPPQAPLV